MQASKRQHLSIVLSALFLVAGALLTACRSGTPATSDTTAVSATVAVPEPAVESATSTPPPAVGEGYPAPQVAADQPAYPANGVSGLPVPTALPDGYPPTAGEEPFQEPRFHIDQPALVAGATLVEGQAPPNTVLALLDVSYNGTLLGTGRSDDNGRFSIAVSPGLVAGNRIGVTVGELAPGQSLNQMAEAYYPFRGEGFMNLPNVGIMFDTALVQP